MCPACEFVGESGRLECGRSISQKLNRSTEKEAKAAEAKGRNGSGSEAEEQSPQTALTDASGLSDDWGADAVDMKAYCNTRRPAATSCPYCGNPSVIPGQFTGILKPDFVLPFKLSKEDASRH